MTFFTITLLPIWAFCASIIATLFVIVLAKKLGINDPTDERKVHKEVISSLGGVAIFLTVGAGIFLFDLNLTNDMLGILGGASVLFVLGLIDDLRSLAAKLRLGVQLSLALWVSIYILEPNAIFHLGDPVSTFLSVLIIVGFINAFNLIDGINGLSGTLGILAFSVLSAILYTVGAYELALLGLLMTGALLGFLVFNFRKSAYIFMGDNGSTVVGFTVAVLLLKYLTIQPSAWSDLTSIIIIAVSGVAILDMVYVMMYRLYLGKSPMEADRNHIHHSIVDNGVGHQTATIIILLVQLALSGLAYLFIEAHLVLMIASTPLFYILIRIGFYKAFRTSRKSATKPIILGQTAS